MYNIIPCESFPNSVHSRLEYYSANLNLSKSNISKPNLPSATNLNSSKSNISKPNPPAATNLNSSRSN